MYLQIESMSTLYSDQFILERFPKIAILFVVFLNFVKFFNSDLLVVWAFSIWLIIRKVQWERFAHLIRNSIRFHMKIDTLILQSGSNMYSFCLFPIILVTYFTFILSCSIGSSNGTIFMWVDSMYTYLFISTRRWLPVYLLSLFIFSFLPRGFSSRICSLITSTELTP